jgi:hypothetical protein
VHVARVTLPITTDADFAVTEFDTELAPRGRLLVGPYSRFGIMHRSLDPQSRQTDTILRRLLAPARHE